MFSSVTYKDNSLRNISSQVDYHILATISWVTTAASNMTTDLFRGPEQETSRQIYSIYGGQKAKIFQQNFQASPPSLSLSGTPPSFSGMSPIFTLHWFSGPWASSPFTSICYSYYEVALNKPGSRLLLNVYCLK